MIHTIIDYLKKKENKILSSVLEIVKTQEGEIILRDEPKHSKDKQSKDKPKKRNNKQKPKKKKNQTSFNVDTDVQLIAIYKSVKQNYIFYIAVLCSLYAFTKCKHNKSDLFLGGFTIVFITFYGYMIHFLSHYMDLKLTKMYSKYDNAFTRNKYFNWCMIRYINFAEFHARTHHDTDVNKSYKNITFEFFNNLMTQGLCIIILKYFLDLLDNRVIILWAFFYATVHNINYNIESPLTHRQHHMNDRTNYGIDIWDILIGSKYEWDTIETHNHTAINIILITAVIMFVSNKLKL